MTQSSLSDFGVEESPAVSETVRVPMRPGGAYCCPWCLAPPRLFRKSRTTDETICGRCKAGLPIRDGEPLGWFARGETIASPQWVYKMYKYEYKS